MMARRAHVSLHIGETNRENKGGRGSLSIVWRKDPEDQRRVYKERARLKYQRATASTRDKTCPRCGVRFTAANANVLRCSDCRVAVGRERDAAKKRRRRAAV